MRKMASVATATTVLTTTQTDVKRECGGKTKCSTTCGSTYCDYVCDDPKKQCTVAVFMKKPKQSPKPTGATALKSNNP
jgi:hypothetical protein